jgi:hypothetical protein
MRCPSCDTYINEAGFHFQDKMTSFIVGESTLLWDKATKALEKVSKYQLLLGSFAIYPGLTKMGGIISGGKKLEHHCAVYTAM